MILLDTHAWIWWANQSQKLSALGRRRIEAESELGVAVISCWEVTMLVEKGRLELDRKVGLWVHLALALPKIVLLPLIPDIAVTAAQLPASFQGDPADRMIVSTGRLYGIAIVTKDRRIHESGLVTIIW